MLKSSCRTSVSTLSQDAPLYMMEDRGPFFAFFLSLFPILHCIYLPWVPRLFHMCTSGSEYVIWAICCSILFVSQWPEYAVLCLCPTTYKRHKTHSTNNKNARNILWLSNNKKNWATNAFWSWVTKTTQRHKGNMMLHPWQTQMKRPF